MKFFLKNIIILFFILIFIPLKIEAGTFDTTYARILQDRIEQLRSNYSLVGISAAALVPGQGIWTGTSGISSSDSDAITTDMVMGAGSITKNFIAAIIMQLNEADSLSLSDSIGKWLPIYSNVNNSITVRQLLDHTSGIYNVTENINFIAAINSNLGRRWTIDEVMTGGYVLNPYFNPGAGWHYSNTGYMILGVIITKILRQNLSQIFRERFYIPFNLSGSFFEVDDTVTKPEAHNWADITGTGIIQDAFFIPKTALNSSTIGAGGVITRPENLVRWLDNLYRGNIISTSSLTQMLTFRSVNIAGGNGYGLGTIRYVISGGTGYGHGGNTFGYTSVMIYDPRTQISISVMMNRDLNGGPVGINFMNTAIQNIPVDVHTISYSLPESFKLYQNYPNPFNPTTNLRFGISVSPHGGSDLFAGHDGRFVTLKIYDALGKEVLTPVNEKKTPGNYSIQFNARNLPSGIYYYSLFVNGNLIDTKKMMLMK